MTTRNGKRRPSTEVRELVLTAARDMFDEFGYSDASTREIAQRAGVTEAAIFRHFGSKEGLFERLALEELDAFISDFVERWSDPATWEVSNEDFAREYIAAMFELVRRNRILFGVLATSGGSRGQERAARARLVLSEHLGDLEERLRARSQAMPVIASDQGLAIRFTIALVFGLVLFDTTFFPPESHPEPPDLIEELIAFILRGAIIDATQAPASGTPNRRSKAPKSRAPRRG